MESYETWSVELNEINFVEWIIYLSVDECGTMKTASVHKSFIKIMM